MKAYITNASIHYPSRLRYREKRPKLILDVQAEGSLAVKAGHTLSSTLTPTTQKPIRSYWFIFPARMDWSLGASLVRVGSSGGTMQLTRRHTGDVQ